MLKVRHVVGVLFISISLSFVYGISAEEALAKAKRTVLVKFKEEHKKEGLNKIQSFSTGESGIKNCEALGITLVEAKEEQEPENVSKIFDKAEEVEFAEPNYTREFANCTPKRKKKIQNEKYPALNLVDLSRQWGLEKIDCVGAWGISRGKKEITIAVLDTGVDTDHIDLYQNVIDGYDMVQEQETVSDTNGHGTHCAGIIGGLPSKKGGILGVAYKCKIMPVRVMYGDQGFVSWIAKGIRWAVDKGADVISMSFTSPKPSKVEEDAIKYAIEKGVILVAAAGNDGKNVKRYPACYDGVLSVGSVDQKGKRSDFSNYGDFVDVAAPGTKIYSTVPGDGYEEMDGTSMACPYVSGLAGLIKSLYPEATRVQVCQLICDSAEKLGGQNWDWCNRGLVNVEKTLEAACEKFKKSHFVGSDIITRKLGSEFLNSPNKGKKLSKLSYEEGNAFMVGSIRGTDKRQNIKIEAEFTIKEENWNAENITLETHLFNSANTDCKISVFDYEFNDYWEHKNVVLPSLNKGCERAILVGINNSEGNLISKEGKVKVLFEFKSPKQNFFKKLFNNRVSSYHISTDMMRLIVH